MTGLLKKILDSGIEFLCVFSAVYVQVATHVQKYFIKLANAGLPVPGRMPNISKYPKKKVWK